MNFSQLEAQLPDQSIVWNGFGAALQVNANLVTGDAITIESSPVEFMVKLLAAMFRMQTEVNTERESEGKDPISLIDRQITLTDDEKLQTVYTVTVTSNLATALDSLIDPTVDEE